MKNLLLLMLLTSGMMWGQTEPYDGETFRRTEYTASSGTTIAILWNNTCDLDHPSFYTFQNSVEFTWVGPAGSESWGGRTNDYWLSASNGDNPNFINLGLLVNENAGFDNNFINCRD